MFQIYGYNVIQSVNLLDELSKSIPYDRFARLIKARDYVNHCHEVGKNPFDVARERLAIQIEDLNELESILKPCLRHKLNSSQ